MIRAAIRLYDGGPLGRSKHTPGVLDSRRASPPTPRLVADEMKGFAVLILAAPLAFQAGARSRLGTVGRQLTDAHIAALDRLAAAAERPAASRPLSLTSRRRSHAAQSNRVYPH
jgi:hypothetical protein